MRLLIGLLACFLTACHTSGDSTTPAGNISPIILLFNGRGTSPNDVAALGRILSEHHYSYSTADSARLNGMSESDLRGFRLLIVPGGNFVEIGNGLTSSTAATLRQAIQGGLSYFGVCAGAFFAGNSPYNGLNLTSGVTFPFYSAENRGIHRVAVAIATAGSPTLDQYWEDGPELTGWGEVVARYPEGTAAVVEGMSGHGWVILTATHPEAPDAWRRGMGFTTPAAVDHAYAAMLIDAALNRKWLAHY